RRATGGIGSGMLSAPNLAASASHPVVAEMPRSAMRPGGGAPHYFQRGVTTTTAAGPRDSYQRQNHYFGNNGRYRSSPPIRLETGALLARSQSCQGRTWGFAGRPSVNQRHV